MTWWLDFFFKDPDWLSACINKKGSNDMRKMCLQQCTQQVVRTVEKKEKSDYSLKFRATRWSKTFAPADFHRAISSRIL